MIRRETVNVNSTIRIQEIFIKLFRALYLFINLSKWVIVYVFLHFENFLNFFTSLFFFFKYIYLFNKKLVAWNIHFLSNKFLKTAEIFTRFTYFELNGFLNFDNGRLLHRFTAGWCHGHTAPDRLEWTRHRNWVWIFGWMCHFFLVIIIDIY